MEKLDEDIEFPEEIGFEQMREFCDMMYAPCDEEDSDGRIISDADPGL